MDFDDFECIGASKKQPVKGSGGILGALEQVRSGGGVGSTAGRIFR